eukprot:4952751-Pyramimonas_sp.AAC.1
MGGPATMSKAGQGSDVFSLTYAEGLLHLAIAERAQQCADIEDELVWPAQPDQDIGWLIHNRLSQCDPT